MGRCLGIEYLRLLASAAILVGTFGLFTPTFAAHIHR